MIVHEFYDWLQNQSYPDTINVDIKVLNLNETSIDNQFKKTICVNFENNSYIGRFIVWDDNSCFFELMKIETETTLLHDRIDFMSLAELKSIYGNFIESIIT